MNSAIQARNLTKTFPGGNVGVSGLDLEIDRGTVFGLVGRNGAGKTTTLRILMGLLRPDHGEARILGEELRNAPHELRARVGYVSQSQQLPGWMTLKELARYAGSFYPKWNSAFVEDLCRRWEIATSRPLATLSGGEQRKAAVLMALASEPEVLILDEPAGGLDPVSRRELINQIVDVLNRRPETTIIFSTHYIGDLERIAEWIGVLDRGRLVMNRPIDEVQSAFRRVQVIFPGEAVPPQFSIPGAQHCSISGPVACGVTEHFDGEHLESLRRWPGVRVQVFPLSLEDIFIQITRDQHANEISNEQENFSEPELIQETRCV